MVHVTCAASSIIWDMHYKQFTTLVNVWLHGACLGSMLPGVQVTAGLDFSAFK